MERFERGRPGRQFARIGIWVNPLLGHCLGGGLWYWLTPFLFFLVIPVIDLWVGGRPYQRARRGRTRARGKTYISSNVLAIPATAIHHHVLSVCGIGGLPGSGSNQLVANQRDVSG